jgi:hypothetical protein
MERDVLMFAQVMTVIVMSVGSFVAIGLGARVLWRMGSKTTPKAMRAFDESRIERIENAVDAIAIEVERISEAQRFTVGLLAERLPARPGERAGDLAPPSASKRVNTPH